VNEDRGTKKWELFRSTSVDGREQARRSNSLFYFSSSVVMLGVCNLMSVLSSSNHYYYSSPYFAGTR
jgi:hypothetical protein